MRNTRADGDVPGPRGARRRGPGAAGWAVLGLASLAAAAVARMWWDASARTPRVTVDGRPAGTGGGAPGLLPPDAAAPPSWEPAALARLAAWVPSAPRTGWARAAGLAWAAPMSLAGLLAGFASGARPRTRHGVVLFAPARGIVGGLLRRRGFSAATLGHVVIACDEPSDALMAHELVHVRQAERLGPLMAPAYLGLTAAYGYAAHPMERAARLAQREARG